MKTNHLSAWEQEEYVLDQRTPEMLRHLTECAGCRAAVARLAHGVAIFRSAAVEWSSECLVTRPQLLHTVARSRPPVVGLRWAFAAVLPVALLVFALLSFHPSTPQPAHSAALAISDDALLEQVDEQLSVAVPSSMESLTHLVSTESSNVSGAATSARGSKHSVQTN
jgi:predicted anti-sigma-YlaC factor YlaD